MERIRLKYPTNVWFHGQVSVALLYGAVDESAHSQGAQLGEFLLKVFLLIIMTKNE